MKLTKWYSRLRHARGFGIHSPSAYRLIREVLRPSSRYAYYAYPQLKRIAVKPYTAAELKLIFRLLAEFQPGSVAVVGSKRRDAMVETVRLAVPSALIVDSPSDADFVIYGCDATYHGIDSPVAYFSKAQSNTIDECTRRMTEGHIFRSSRRALIVCRPGLPLQTFNVRF